MHVDRSITSEDVIDALADLFAKWGVPKCICSDNGPELVARAIRTWLRQVDVETLYVEHGSPWENGSAESFRGRLRNEFLATEMFESLAAAQALTRHWPSIPPESIASTVSFLVSDAAADVSGEEIGVWRGGPVGV